MIYFKTLYKKKREIKQINQRVNQKPRQLKKQINTIFHCIKRECQNQHNLILDDYNWRRLKFLKHFLLYTYGGLNHVISCYNEVFTL